ncbi:MAG: hypothetical protein SGPRY_011672 [Prymnesium sp.]
MPHHPGTTSLTASAATAEVPSLRFTEDSIPLVAATPTTKDASVVESNLAVAHECYSPATETVTLPAAQVLALPASEALALLAAEESVVTPTEEFPVTGEEFLHVTEEDTDSKQHCLITGVAHCSWGWIRLIRLIIDAVFSGELLSLGLSTDRDNVCCSSRIGITDEEELNFPATDDSTLPTVEDCYPGSADSSTTAANATPPRNAKSSLPATEESTPPTVLPASLHLKLASIQSSLYYPAIAVDYIRNGRDCSMQRMSPFLYVYDTLAERRQLIDQIAVEDRIADRAMGCMVGMALGDSIGHPLEFLDVSDPGQSASFYDLATHDYTCPYNRFGLVAGQWTDDCSMGLCLADSLLACGKLFDGADCRTRFWCWWFCGLNNAFRNEPSTRLSVGLGGNISRSLYSMIPHHKVTPAFESTSSDAGNGSLMRLGPVPVAYWNNVGTAASIARMSSLTTHPGPIAAEACAFVATVIAHAIAGERREGESARRFLERCADDYERLQLSSEASTAEASKAQASRLLRRLLLGVEPDHSLERCWNWRANSLDLQGTVARRGQRYNGYPNSAGYFGSFCLDGLAMAMYSIAQTDSFEGAVAFCVNLCGDADSTGAICGQIAGAIYGLIAIPRVWQEDLQRWDNCEIALRAAILARMPAAERCPARYTQGISG